MTTQEPLLPCPFCGAKMALRGDYTHDHAWNFYTHEDREERDNCILSQYEIPCGPDFITPTKSLTDAWNRRAMPLQDHARPTGRQIVALLDRALVRIAPAAIGSCTCETKNDDLAYHRGDCRARLIELAIRDLADARAAMVAEQETRT